MGEAAGHLPRPAGRLTDGGFGRRLDAVVERLETLPGDRRLERVADDAARHGELAQIRHADEGVAPAAGRALAMRGGALGVLGHAAVVGAAFKRASHPGVDRMVAGLEGEHHDGGRAVAGAGIVRLLRIEDAAIGGVEPGLRDGAHGACGGKEVLEAHAAAGAETRPVLQPHPRPRDDAEDAFRADEHAVGARAGAGAGQPARLQHAFRASPCAATRPDRRCACRASRSGRPSASRSSRPRSRTRSSAENAAR